MCEGHDDVCEIWRRQLFVKVSIDIDLLLLLRSTQLVTLWKFYLSIQKHLHLTSALRSVACRGPVMPGATAWLDAPYQILVLSSSVWWSLLLDIRFFWRYNMTSYSRLQTTFWRSLLTQHAYSGNPEQRQGRGAVKQLRAMETYKKQKNRYQLCFFLFINNVDLKNININYTKSF